MLKSTEIRLANEKKRNDIYRDKVATWYNKLKQLEDIEEELGVDLVIFLKVCIEEVPVYSKDSYRPLFPYEFDKAGFTAAYEDEYDAKSFLWKYYGKTCEQYNGFVHYLGYKGNLVQEEYDLLKEVLLCKTI